MNHCKEDRIFYKSLGLCTRCGKVPIFKNESACPECKAKWAEEKAKQREENREEYNAYQRGYSKCLYEERKKQGICTRCGKKPSVKEESMCDICKYKLQVKRNYQRKREQWLADGKCYFCGDEPYQGMKVCEIHYRISMDNLSKSNGSEVYRKAMNQSYSRNAVSS